MKQGWVIFKHDREDGSLHTEVGSLQAPPHADTFTAQPFPSVIMSLLFDIAVSAWSSECVAGHVWPI